VPSDLGAFLRETIDPADPSAALMLSVASGMVRDLLEMQGFSVDPVANDVVLVDPINGAFLFLDGMPVTDVTLVETFDGTVWTTADPLTYSVSKRTGVISALPWTGVQWPTNPETWRVTYDHGFTTLPDSILGVVLGVAARAWTAPPGIDQEAQGPRNVKYRMESNGFTAIENRILAAYTNPRIA
jgi:hypothetical protein